MVNAEYLVLVENTEQLFIERARRCQIGAERLLDDNAPPNAVFLARQSGLAEMNADRRETGRWRGEIKQSIALGSALALDASQFFPDFFVSGFVIGLALDVGDAGEQAFEHSLVDLTIGKLRQAFGEIVAKRLV